MWVLAANLAAAWLIFLLGSRLSKKQRADLDRCVWCKRTIASGEPSIDSQFAWGDAQIRRVHLECEQAALCRFMCYFWFFAIIGGLGVLGASVGTASDLLSGYKVEWQCVLTIALAISVVVSMPLVFGILVLPWRRRLHELEAELSTDGGIDVGE